MALSKIQTGFIPEVTASDLESPLNLSSKTVNISNVNNTFPAGHIVQTVHNTPGTTIQLQLSTSPPSFTEFHSSYRISFTPKFSNSILKLTWNGLVGGRNQSTLMSFKFYDQTNSSNVQTSTLGTGSNRTFCNASTRDMASDTNDRVHLNMIAYQAASNTNARTYSIYGAMESGATFNVNMTSTDNAGCSYVSPSFTIEEIAQ